nr:extracellular solute-binding protein [bacterium]
MEMHRIRFAKMPLAGIVCLIAFLGGCTATGSPEPTLTPTTEPTPVVSATPARELRWPANIDFGAMQGKKIVAYLFSANANHKLEMEMCDEFSEKFGVEIGGMHVSPDTLPNDVSHLELLKYIRVTSEGKTVPTVCGFYDINGSDIMPQAAIFGMLQPVDQWLDPLDNTFLHAALDSTSWRGKHYCLQFTIPHYDDSSNFAYPLQAISYNKTQFARLGMEEPLDLYLKGEWTWDSLITASRQLNRSNPEDTTAYRGFYVNEEVAMALLRHNGAHLFEEQAGDYKVTLQQPAAQEVLTMLALGVSNGDFKYRRDQYNEASMMYCGGYRGTSEPPYTNDEFQGVPLPCGPSSAVTNLGYMYPDYAVLLQGAAHPEIGYALLWYMGASYKPYLPIDGRNIQGTIEYKNIPNVNRFYEEVFSKLDNERIVFPDPYKGVPGLEALYKEMCQRIFKDGMPLSRAMEVYVPHMQRALDALVMEAAPDP